MARGSEVRIIGGRICGAANPYNAVSKDRIEVDTAGLDVRVYEFRALDAAGRPVDMAASHASASSRWHSP